MALSTLYLIDKSAWVQASYGGAALGRMGQLKRLGRLAICTVTIAELLYSARNRRHIHELIDEFDDLVELQMSRATERQVVSSMLALAEKGHHRRPVPDLLVAAVAWAHDAVVLHYDRDFDLIAEVTGQRTEWIVERGSGHGEPGESP